MKKRLLLFFILLFFSPTIIKAESNFTTNFVVNQTGIQVGQNINVTINLSGLNDSGLAAGMYYIHYDSSKMSYVSYSVGQGKPANDFNFNQNGSDITIAYIDGAGGDNPLKNGVFVTLTFKAISEGTASINLSGEGFASGGTSIVDLSTNTASKNIPISKKIEQKEEKEENTENNNNQNNQTTNNNTNNSNNNEVKEENKLSSDASLKELKIEEFELEFDPSIYEYNIEVPYKTTKLNINYIPNNTKSTVELVNNELQLGQNEITLKVTSEDKTEKKIYKINVVRKDKVINLNSINLVSLINSGIDFVEVDIDYNSDKIIEKSIIDLIKEKEVELKLNFNKSDKNIYYVILNKENLKNVNENLNLNINDQLSGKKIDIGNAIVLNLLENENWNNDITIYYNIKNLKSNNLYVYEYSDNLSLVNKIDSSDSYLKLNIEGKKQYILSDNELSIKSNNSTTNIVIYILIIIIVALSIYCIFLNLKLRKKAKV